MELDQLKKIHSLSLDSNILLDLPEAPKFQDLKAISDKEKHRAERVFASLKIAQLCLSENVILEKIGLKIVQKEISQSPELLPIFKRIFPKTVKPDRTARNLANEYMNTIGLDTADALVVSTASVNGIDVLLSWNRKDVANPQKRDGIAKINHDWKVKTPTICDPHYFIERLVRSQGTHDIRLALNPNPIPKVFRLGFYPSK
jgi:predicted nucleic acid-binding protein